MTKKWLGNLLQDNTLVDNQTYIMQGGILTNRRFPEDITLHQRRKKDIEIWQFLNDIALNMRNVFSHSDDIYNALVLFNDEEYEHNTEDSFFDITGKDVYNFWLNTGNLIGSIKSGGYAVKISSRFGDAFLKYIIAEADGFLEVKNLGGEDSKESYEWLLAYIWNIKLKKAFRLGVPKIYVSQNKIQTQVRGAIDPVDYFQNRALGKFKCSFREHSYDNPAISLFIRAYEIVQTQYSFCQATRNIYNAFLTESQGAKRSYYEMMSAQYFRNPFYSDYNVLIDLSKKIVGRSGYDCGLMEETSAFFFDISMLFEYFIRKLLKHNHIRLHDKFKKRCEIPSGALGGYKRKIEPDLVVDSVSGFYIFDVKYKNFDSRYGVKREDIFQLHTYIGQYGNNNQVQGCGFIYPISEQRWNDLNLDQSKGIISDIIYQQDKKIPFFILFLKIPMSEEGASFGRMMSESCEVFIKGVKQTVLGRS